VVLIAVALGGMPVWAASQEDGAQPASALSFDIPALPLDEALFAYTHATGVGVLVEDGLAAGRHAAAVKGRFTPQAALSLLLSGTGLDYRYTAADAFTLVPIPAALAAPAQPSDPPRDDAREQAYFRTVQTAVKHVLCRHARTLPGAYRMALQLWIGASGTVLRTALLSSTGSRDRDSELSAMLNGLPIGEAPPTGLPEPVTMVILPRSPGVTGDCAPVDGMAPTKVKG
jgi:hypothetical protein